MKKMMILGFALLFSLSLVSAVPEQVTGGGSSSFAQERMNDRIGDVRNDSRGLANGPAGLSQALVMVSNEEARERLEGNLERFLAMNEITLGNASSVSLSEKPGNRTRAQFREEVRFLGIFPVDAQEEVLIENGAPIDVRKNVWARLVDLGVAR